MSRYDFRTPRLFVAAPLAAGAAVPLEPAQGHYLAGVLRLRAGDAVLAFNGMDGEWRCRLVVSGKRIALEPEQQTRSQTSPGDLHYLFAPLKKARLDYMVQKAVEMGVSRLQPVMTRHTQAERVNLDRMRANAIEAAEQCGILTVPDIMPPTPLDRAVAALEPSRHLIFCDEDAPVADPLAALVQDFAQDLTQDFAQDDSLSRPFGGGSGSGLPAAGASIPNPKPSPARGGGSRIPLAVVIGPEGGFDEDERALLCRRPRTSRIALGPRILRADTAAVAALAIVQAAVGDWRPEAAPEFLESR